MIPIYLAGAYASRDTLRGYRDHIFEPSGFRVVSRWLDEDFTMTAGVQHAANDLSQPVVKKIVDKNLYDVQRASTLVVFTDTFTGKTGGGGKHVEVGLAIAEDIPVIYVGEPENVFQRALGFGAESLNDVLDLLVYLHPFDF